jgi:PAS domain S-box-containing protein
MQLTSRVVLESPTRLIALANLGVLDAPPDTTLDQLARLAARILLTPVALICFVDRDRQWFASSTGLNEPWASARQTPLSHSFCQHVVHSGEPFVVTDAREHPLVATNRAISDLGVISYAGVPLRTSDGHIVGSFCGIDHKPRIWTSHELTILHDLAATAISSIETKTHLLQQCQPIHADHRHKQVEQEPTQLESHLSAALTNIQESIWSIDRHYRLITANSSFFRSTANERGCAVQVGANLLENIPSEKMQQWRAWYDRALAGEQFAAEYSSVVDGAEQWFELLFSPIEAKSTVIGVSIISRDTTARRQAEEERAALEQAWPEMQRLESIGVLTGGIAHDFNNLLTTMLGHTHLLLMDMPQDSFAYESLLRIEQAGRQATSLIRQMLVYAGRSQVEQKMLDLTTLIQNLLLLLDTAIPRHVEFEQQLTPLSILVAADEAQIQQVVMNLIINASEAIDDQPGTLTIATSARTITEPVPATTLGALSPGEYVELVVTDTGCGMDQQILNQIFDPFFTTKFAGRGLGLAVVRGIIQAHRGALTVTSSPGKGTTFRVFLPGQPLEPSSVLPLPAEDDSALVRAG